MSATRLKPIYSDNAAETILGKREPSVEEPQNDVDKCAKFIC